MTTRVYAPIGGGQNQIGDKTYKAAEGTSLDVADDIAFMLVATGWASAGLVGTTAQRPTLVTGLKRGLTYLDTSVGVTIIYEGKNWRNPSNNAIV